MSFFKRGKNKGPKKGADAPSPGEARTSSKGPEDEEGHSSAPHESSPQRVGIVSGVLTTSATIGGPSPLGEIVDRHFGPDASRNQDKEKKQRERARERVSDLPPQHEHLRAVEPLLEDEMDSPRLEIDPMAHVGHATTITGSIVAEEDLEIQGTIEGSIRLANHRLTVGSDGVVKASVEAHTVLVLGRISGDVVASELVEIKPGGVIGGDVKSPRVIMHDGGVVVGGMDMTASLPSSGEAHRASPSTDSKMPPMPERPKLKSVESSRDSATDEGTA